MAANIQERFEPRTPALQFELPLEDVTAPHNDKMRAPVAYTGDIQMPSVTKTICPGQVPGAVPGQQVCVRPGCD